MTDAQKKIIYILLVTISGAAASTIANLFHVVPADVQPYLDILKAITASLGAAWGLTAFNANGVVASASSLPEVATVVIKDGTRGALGEVAADPAHPDIVSETQNEADAKAGTKT